MLTSSFDFSLYFRHSKRRGCPMVASHAERMAELIAGNPCVGWMLGGFSNRCNGLLVCAIEVLACALASHRGGQRQYRVRTG